MRYIDYQITNSILDKTENTVTALQSILHWRWSQIERKRRNMIRHAFNDLLISNTEEYSILVFISHTDSPNHSDIKNYLNLEKSSVSEFIKRCIDRQLVLEEQNKVDKRKKMYKLTKVGSQTLELAHGRMESISKIMFETLSSDERKFLLEILMKLKNV